MIQPPTKKKVSFTFEHDWDTKEQNDIQYKKRYQQMSNPYNQAQIKSSRPTMTINRIKQQIDQLPDILLDIDISQFQDEFNIDPKMSAWENAELGSQFDLISKQIYKKSQNEEDSQSESAGIDSQIEVESYGGGPEYKIGSQNIQELVKEESIDCQKGLLQMPFRQLVQIEKQKKYVSGDQKQELFKTFNIEKKEHAQSEISEPSFIEQSFKDASFEKISRKISRLSHNRNLTQSFICNEELENIQNNNIIFKDTQSNMNDGVGTKKKNQRLLNYKQKEQIKKILLPLEFYDFQSTHEKVSPTNSMLSGLSNIDEQRNQHMSAQNPNEKTNDRSGIQKNGQSQRKEEKKTTIDNQENKDESLNNTDQQEEEQNNILKKKIYQKYSKSFWKIKYSQLRNQILILCIAFLIHDSFRHTLDSRDFPLVYKYYIANQIITLFLILFSFKTPLTEKEKQLMSNKQLEFTYRIRLYIRNIMKPHMLVQLALQLQIIRFIIRLFDFENTKEDYQKKGIFVLAILIQTTILRHCIQLYFLNCKINTILSKILGFIYIFTAIVTQLSEKYINYEDDENKVRNKILGHCLVFVLASVFWLCYLNKQHSERMKYSHEMYKKILAQNESNQIVNRLEESIIIVNDKRNDKNGQLGYQIEFVNDLFLNQFQNLLLSFTSRKKTILKSLKRKQSIQNIGAKIQEFVKKQKVIVASFIKQYTQIICQRNQDTFESLQQFDVEQDKIEFFGLSNLKAQMQDNKYKLEELNGDLQDLNFLNVKIFDLYANFSNQDDQIQQQIQNKKAHSNINQTQLNGIDHGEVLLKNLKQRRIGTHLRQKGNEPQLSLMDILNFDKKQIDNSIFYTRDSCMMASQMIMDRQKYTNKPKSSDQVEGTQDYRYVQIKRTEMKRNNKTLKILQLVDISHSILYDQIQAKNDLLSLINACVSHELRNPLNAIIAQNINKECIFRNIRKFLDTITSKDDIEDFELNVKQPVIDYLNELDEGLHVQQASASLMDFLVQDLLDYAQIKAGKFRLNVQPFDIIEAIENVMSIQKLKANERGIDFYIVAENFELNQEQIICSNLQPKQNILKKSKIHIKTKKDESKPMHSYIINCDRQRVMQVLLGLQSNALKFTKMGSVSIHLKILTVDKQQYLQISVIDTGIGIENKDQDKLFQFFGFLQDTKQMNTKGIGLGLVIADQIVKKFDGEINFESVPGKGSNFTYSMKIFTQEEIEAKDSQLSKSQNHNEIKYLANSKELIYKWIPQIQMELKQQVTKSNKKVGTHTKSVTMHLAQTIQYIQQIQENNNNLMIANENDKEKENNYIQYSNSKNNQYIGNQIPFVKLSNKNSTNSEVFQSILPNKILIVDDQEYNILSMKVILKSLNLNTDLYVEHAVSGEQAFEKIVENVQKVNKNQRCSYNLILMDCQMPYMDGYETCIKIREFLFQNRLPQPIISAVTGHTEQEYINKAIESGMNQVLTKPVMIDILVNIVQRVGFQVKQDLI